MNHIVIGTAGHIDHGKTALIKALTGIDADRLKEEKERGMTIDLGFAYFNLSNNRMAEIMDVPGHKRFVKNMLSGTASIDLVLFVIAANEGVMPQTQEHLDILKLLNLKKGIVVITKVDLVEQEWLELVKTTIEEAVKGSFLETAPIVETSVTKGIGIEPLRQTIDQLTKTMTLKNSALPFRLPIDRVFTKSGFGTIITGPIISGVLKPGDVIEVLPQKLSGRVRQLETHGKKVDSGVAGQRVGVNLTGVKWEKVTRGNTLAAPGYLSPTYIFDGTLELIPTCHKPLQNNTRVRLHIGSGEFLGRIILLDQEVIKPGEKGLIQLRAESPLAIIKDDRFVIRRYSPMITIGGGKILDPHPSKHKRLDKKAIQHLTKIEKLSPAELVEQILLDDDAEILDANNILDKVNLSKEEVASILKDLEQQKRLVRLPRGHQLMHINRFLDLKNKTFEALKEFHRNYPLRLNITKRELRSKVITSPEYDRFFDLVLDELVNENKLKMEHGLLRLAVCTVQFTPEQQGLRKRIEQIYLVNKFSPPDIKQLIQDLKVDPKLVKQIITALVELGILFNLSDNITIHRDALEEARHTLKGFFRQKKEIRLGEFSKLLNTSRKYSRPISNYFDAIQFTKRVGDVNVLNQE